MLNFICVDAGGFEDQLTEDYMYAVSQFGANSYKVLNDKGEVVWYGKSHFTIEAE
jgi:hypothetical protein